MKILVTGGRNFYGVEASATAYFCLLAIYERFGISKMIHGGAKGADTLANFWANSMRIPIARYSPDWDDVSKPGSVIRRHADGRKYNAAAGNWRNQEMLEKEKPDLVLALPGGRGTADMINRSKEANVPVLSWPGSKDAFTNLLNLLASDPDLYQILYG